VNNVCWTVDFYIHIVRHASKILFYKFWILVFKNPSKNTKWFILAPYFFLYLLDAGQSSHGSTPQNCSARLKMVNRECPLDMFNKSMHITYRPKHHFLSSCSRNSLTGGRVVMFVDILTTSLTELTWLGALYPLLVLMFWDIYPWPCQGFSPQLSLVVTI